MEPVHPEPRLFAHVSGAKGKLQVCGLAKVSDMRTQRAVFSRLNCILTAGVEVVVALVVVLPAVPEKIKHMILAASNEKVPSNMRKMRLFRSSAHAQSIIRALPRHSYIL